MVQIKCICLIRVSTQQQILEGQKEKVIDAAKADGYKESEIKVVEAKESAIKLKEEQRETLNEMKQIVESTPTVEAIYVFAIDRLARKVSTVLSVKDWLLERKINIVFLNPHKLKTMRINDRGEKVEDELTNMMLLFLAYGAEMEMKLKQARMKVTKDLLRTQNKWASGKPMLGYVKDRDKNIVIDPECGDMIRDIFIEYAKGKTPMFDLYKRLVAKGIMPDKKKSAGKNTILRILKNKAYYGEYSSFDKITNVKYPSIIDKETWDKVQEVISNKKHQPKTNHKNIYYGKSIIRLTNTNMIMVSHISNLCYKSFEGVKCSININAMDTAIWTTTKIFQMIKEMMKKEKPYDYTKEIKENEDKIANIENLLGGIRERQQKAFRLYLGGKVDEKIYDEEINKINKDISEWENEISKYKAEIQMYKMQAQELKDRKINNPALLDNLDDVERKKLIDNIVGEVRLTLKEDNTFEIHIIAKDQYIQQRFNAMTQNTYYKYWVKGGIMHLIRVYGKEEQDISNTIVKRITH